MMEIRKNARVHVAGHGGLVGSGVLRRLQTDGSTSVPTAPRERLDLRDQAAVNYWFRANRPEYVHLAAGTVGGIFANSTRPAEFICDNLMIRASLCMRNVPESWAVESTQKKSAVLLRRWARSQNANEKKTPV